MEGITEKASVDEVYLDVSTLVTQRLEELEQYQAQQKAIGSWTYQVSIPSLSDRQLNQPDRPLFQLS